MQVYKITPTEAYTGGCALVAAKDVNQAISTLCEDDYYEFEYDEYKCTCNMIVGLDYNTETPCIIFNDLYSEW